MPRCGCSGTCSCLIEGGSGIIVDGLGTIEQPYEISQAVLTDSLVFDNSGTVDFTVTGTGDETSPLRVSADAHLKLADLTDVADTPAPINGQVPVWTGSAYVPTTPTAGITVSDTPTLDLTLTGGVLSGVPILKLADLTDVADAPAPTSGQVPTWNGSAYVPATPSSGGGGGTVNTANGISGDGSVGTPVRAKTTGIWGSAPNLNMYGTTPSDQGREIYVDTAGNLRARPDVIWQTPGWAATEPVASYPPGSTVMTIGTADAATWPPAASCIVVTHKRTDSGVAAQWCYNNSSASTRAWYRNGNATSWSPWIEVTAAQTPTPMISAIQQQTSDSASLGTGVIDMPGASLTINVPATTSVFMVHAIFDIQNTATASGTVTGYINVDGADQPLSAVLGQDGQAANQRATVPAQARVTGLGTGNRVFKLRAKATQATSNYRVNANFTSISVQQVS